MKICLSAKAATLPLVILFGCMSQPQLQAKYDPSQDRDDSGKWEGDGSSSSSTGKTSEKESSSRSKSTAKSPKISQRKTARSDSEKAHNEKSERAKASYNPSTKEKQDISEAIENEVTSALGGVKSGDNKPMDVVSRSGRVGFEVKVLHDAKENRINMRKDSRQRKEAWLSQNKSRSAYVVAVDNRDSFQGGKHKDKFSGHKYYVGKGVGAFSLSSMTKARDLNHIKQIVGIA